MRILAIRGCNLASLAGEFEIDLARAPLGGAGVFAIVGNTGAGKSTLLDALCAALFDRTPRLTNHSRVMVGRGEDDPAALGAQDVRTILRRGAAAGWAEVDFEARDDRCYRARWSVRRARGQADGNLQDQQVTLTAIASPTDAGRAATSEAVQRSIDGGERIGGTKTETLKAIHQRLGLSFDQFRRSALLAQGEFAAFLRADGKDRSELLERMTGTEIYSKLSIAAHLRASLAEQRLREGRTVAMAIPVLDDLARAGAEADLELATAAKHAARDRLACAEGAARWVGEARRRDDELAEAMRAHAAAESAIAAAGAERAELALRRRAEALRATWDVAARFDRQLAASRGEVAAATEAAAKGAALLRDVAAKAERLRALYEPVRASRIAARLVERAGEPADAEAKARAAAADAAWLAQRAGLAVEVGGWADLDGRFAQYDAVAEAIGNLDRAIRGHVDARAKVVRTRDETAVEHQQSNAKLGEAQRRAASFRERRGLTLEAARRLEDESRQRCAEVDRLVAIAEHARQAATARAELDRQLVELAVAAAADASQRGASEAARESAALLRNERGRVVFQLRTAAGYEHARAELVDGEACPLCGASEHPWRGGGAFDEVIREAEARLAEVSTELDAASSTLAAIAARAVHREAERARLAAGRDVAQGAAASAIGMWRDQLASLGELILVDDPATPAAGSLAAERAAAARRTLEEARTTRSQTEAATKAAADAQAQIQACHANLELIGGKLAELDRKLTETDAALERLRGEREARSGHQRELAGELDAAFARWALPEVADVGARRLAMAATVKAWHQRAAAVIDAEAAVHAALAEIERTARDGERALAEHDTRRVEIERRRDHLIAELAIATETLEAARAAAGFDATELHRLLADASPARLEALVEHLASLDRGVERSRAVVAERHRHVADHAALRPPGIDDAAQVDELAAAAAAADQRAANLAAALAADADARIRREAALAGLATAEQAAEVDRVLGEVIGSHDGKLFRSFAQSLTLDGLLAVANSHLEELAPRYQLERVPRHDLELQVIDRDLGAEVRSVQSLSGGEAFLVSLALALGLSSMSAHDVRVRTLLIDEGFGTLDPASLDSALAVLDALQATGRQVGVISHVPALVERVGAHVKVIQRGGGRSEVVVAEA